MRTILIIGSIFGIVNSLILIIYPLFSKKGNKTSNRLFSLVLLMVTFQLLNSIIPAFSEEPYRVTWISWLMGYILIGPIYYLFVCSILNNKFSIRTSSIVNFIPALLLLIIWVTVNDIKTDYKIWNIYHRIISLHQILFLAWTVYLINSSKYENKKVIKQLNIFSYFLLGIWLTSLLNEITGLDYITGALLYCFMIFVVFRIVFNKGYIIDNTTNKYQKTGLKETEKVKIQKLLDNLLTNDKVYTDNTISIGKIAKLMNTSIHNLSQVINEHYNLSFFELISNNRIVEAKKLLLKEPDTKVSDIAYGVGYNSLSAFNTAFKKQTGKTPSKYRNGN